MVTDPLLTDPLFKFALATTALIGLLVLIVATGLVVQKVRYAMRARRRARLDELYGQKMDPLLLEDLPTASTDVASLLFRRGVKEICEPLQTELHKINWFSRRSHRAALKRVMLGISRDLVGETRARLTQAFEIFGFVKEELRDLSSRRWWVRAKACRSLAAMQAENAIGDLDILLNDEEEVVQTEAAMALVTIAGMNGLRRVLAKLPKITVWMSIKFSKVVLSMGSAAVPELIEALKSDLPSIKSFSIEMLGEIRDIAACGPLTEFVRMAEPVELKCKALLAIGELGDEAGKDILLEHLSDDDEAMRISAAQGLGYLASPETVADLKDHLLHDSKRLVRLAAGTALRRIHGAGKDFFVGVYREADTITKMIVLESLEELGVPEETIREIAQ